MARTRMIQVAPRGETVPELTARPDDITRYFGSLVWAAMNLASGGSPTEAPDTLHDRLLRQVEDAQRRAEMAGFGRETVNDASYATVALLDASIVSTRGPHATAWASRPLELSVFGTATAGAFLQRRLEAAMHRNDRDALLMYRLCLLGGFEGDKLDPAARARVIATLDHGLGFDRRDGLSALLAAPNVATATLAPPMPTARWWVLAAVALAAIATVLALVVGRAASEVDELAARVASAEGTPAAAADAPAPASQEAP